MAGKSVKQINSQPILQNLWYLPAIVAVYFYGLLGVAASYLVTQLAYLALY